MPRPGYFCLAFAFLTGVAGLTASSEPRDDAVAPAGDLDLHYDAEAWDVTSGGTGTHVTCRADGCRGVSLAITVADPDEPPCTEALLTSYWGTEDAKMVRTSALSFIVTTHDFGCRNLAGGAVYACTAHAGKTYLVAAPGDHCQTPWQHDEIVLGVLDGLRPR